MRVEPHGDGLRLTVTINPGIAQRFTAKPCNLTRVSDALTAVTAWSGEVAGAQRISI